MVAECVFFNLLKQVVLLFKINLQQMQLKFNTKEALTVRMKVVTG